MFGLNFIFGRPRQGHAPSRTHARQTPREADANSESLHPPATSEIAVKYLTLEEAKLGAQLAKKFQSYTGAINDRFRHYVKSFEEFLTDNRTDARLLLHPMAREAYEHLLGKLLWQRERKHLEAALEFLDLFPLPSSSVNTPTLRGARVVALERNCEYKETARRLISTLKIPESDVAEIISNRVLDCITRDQLPPESYYRQYFGEGEPIGTYPAQGAIMLAKRMLAAELLPRERILTPNLKARALLRIRSALSRGYKGDDAKLVDGIIDLFQFEDRYIRPELLRASAKYLVSGNAHAADRLRTQFNLAVRDIAGYALLQGEIDQVHEYLKEHGATIATDELPKILPAHVRAGLKAFNVVETGAIVEFCKDNQEYRDAMFNVPNLEVALREEEVKLLDSLCITAAEALYAKSVGVDLKDTLTKGSFSKLTSALCAHAPEWVNDEANVVNFFNQLKKTLGGGDAGAKRALRYMYRCGVSRHDSLLAAPFVAALLKSSGMQTEEFCGRILYQIPQDGSHYEAGSAHQQFAALARALDSDIESVLGKARRSLSTTLRSMAAEFPTVRDVFTSWRKFQRYTSITRYLGRADLLEKFEKLNSNGHAARYRYVTKLALSPLISLDHVLQIGLEPAKFLDLGDMNSPELTKRKKPSNYVEIPHLDLNPDNLVDALANRALDAMQVHPSLIIVYDIPRGFISIRDSLQRALGSKENKIRPQAHRSSKLFHEAKQILKKHGISPQEYLAGKVVPPETEYALCKHLFDPKVGLTPEWLHIEAKVCVKSDPDAATAGDETGCCMAFGTGKNNVYTFNLNTAQFVLRIIHDGGDGRTFAQSVVTKDRNIDASVPSLQHAMRGGRIPFFRMVPDTILLQAERYLALDNVETNGNYRTQEWTALIRALYRDFFSEYLKRFAAKMGVNAQHVPVGSAPGFELRTIPNTFAPQAPLSYSDKVGNVVWLLDVAPNAAPLPFRRQVLEETVPKLRVGSDSLPRGVLPLTFEDTLAVAYLESQAYDDNHLLREELHDIENGLFAKDINNTAKGRQNMSLKYVDPNNRLSGYLLAYQGIAAIDNRRRQNPPEKVIYIADFASGSRQGLAAAKLLKGFSQLYTDHYLAKGKLYPVLARFRESTSLRLVERKLDSISEEMSARLGQEVRFERQNLHIDRESKERMHTILLRPIVGPKIS